MDKQFPEELKQRSLIPRAAVVAAGKLLEHRLFHQPLVAELDGGELAVPNKPAYRLRVDIEPSGYLINVGVILQ